MNRTKILRDWLAQFDDALRCHDIAKTNKLFHEECYWRDLLAFTWNIKTLEGIDAIAAMLEKVLPKVLPHSWSLSGDAEEEEACISGYLTFETSVMKGEGHVRLRGGKCWTLLTSARILKGHEETKPEVEDEKRAPVSSELKSPYCLIIGGGQCGIALGARLKKLKVPTVILDKGARPGDSWRNRYHALTLHDPVWTHHLPYVPFPKNWPTFPHKDQLADWLEAYTHQMGLDYWPSSECVRAEYLESEERWKVLVNRGGEHIPIYCQQLVLATGMSGLPFIPQFPGSKSFKGEQCHSTRYKSANSYAGKQCIVLGSSTSAHDICADLSRNGAIVTMIQPSSSSVVRLDTLMEYSFNKHLSLSTHQADLLSASIPYKVKAAQGISLYRTIKQKDSVFYDQLTKAGFLLDFGEDESGLSMKYHRRGSGYYFDVGASKLIIEGQIKLKSGSCISLMKEHSIVLTDGTELPADLIVYATGFRPMEEWIAGLISKEVAEKVGPCWGIGSNTKKDPGPWEGELRNMWKPTKQKNLWIHGGNLAQSRFYSLLLALQIKAAMEKVPMPVY